jgi:hypothetical protein
VLEGDRKPETVELGIFPPQGGVEGERQRGSRCRSRPSDLARD